MVFIFLFLTHFTLERGGEGEVYGKSNRETYITICKIDSQGEFAVWLRKLKQGLGWDAEGEIGRAHV